MLRVKFNASFAEFESGRFKADVKKFAEEAVKEALRYWLADMEAIIPVWSGRSRSTLSRAARFAGYTLNLTPKRTAVLKSGKFRKNTGPAPSQGIFSYRAAFNEVEVTMGTSLQYWAEENEIKRVPHIRFTSIPLPPYRSFEKTIPLMKKRLIAKLQERYPDISKYVKYRRR